MSSLFSGESRPIGHKRWRKIGWAIAVQVCAVRRLSLEVETRSSLLLPYHQRTDSGCASPVTVDCDRSLSLWLRPVSCSEWGRGRCSLPDRNGRWEMRLILTVNVHAAAQVLFPRHAKLYGLYGCKAPHRPRGIHWFFP